MWIFFTITLISRQYCRIIRVKTIERKKFRNNFIKILIIINTLNMYVCKNRLKADKDVIGLSLPMSKVNKYILCQRLHFIVYINRFEYFCFILIGRLYAIFP